MKKSILLSGVATLFLLGFTSLQADVVKGEAAAKAKVEEVQMKEEFKAKEDMTKFKKEAQADAKKLDDSAKVKALEAKDTADAKKKAASFMKNSEADKKKILK